MGGIMSFPWGRWVSTGDGDALVASRGGHNLVNRGKTIDANNYSYALAA